MLNVMEMLNQARRLPVAMPEFTPNAGIGPIPTNEGTLSENAKAMLAAWKPVIEKADWANMAGAPAYRKHFELTAKLVMAQMLNNIARATATQWQREATLAGTDVPSYARQVIGTVLRAYPRLMALQLFPVVPFSGPDGRVFFRDFKYNKAYTGSVPNVADGDRTDDLTKFNKDYFKIGQGEQANKLKVSISSLVVSVDSYRIVADWTYEGDDDYAALYGGDLGSAVVGHAGFMLEWVTDRTMLEAAMANVPAGNAKTWDSTAGGAYAAMTPSEQKAYDETLLSKGILSVITAITTKRLMTAAPNWAVAAPDAVEKLLRLNTFVASGDLQGGVDLASGPIRDVGALRQLGIRVLVDPQQTAGTILFGHRPTSEFNPAIAFCPYKPIVTTGQVEDPEYGTQLKGVRSRFGVAVPNTGTNPASSQLADVYGKLTIS